MDRRTLVPIVAMGALCACSGADQGGATQLTQNWVSGLEVRPSNPNCVAPEREPIAASVALPRVFPNLRFPGAVALVQAPGEDSRWFVVERAGRVRVFPNEESTAAALDFLDLRSRVGANGEGELLGFALHPRFATNGLAYVNFVTRAGAELRLVTAEFSSPDGGLTLDPGSQRILLSVVTPGTARMGGRLDFGPDGYLYLGNGDGGSQDGNPQDARTLLGKMLRIDVDQPLPGRPYAIPSDNPFAGNARCNVGGANGDACPEIYALGFRDPRHWAFDRQSRALWVIDSGMDSFTVIHRVERGGNYSLASPVARYERPFDSPVAGSVVYRGSMAPALSGRLIIANFAGGMPGSLPPGGGVAIEALARADGTSSGTADPVQVAAFGESKDGELLAIDRARGEIHQLLFSAGGGGDNVPELLSETGCLNTAAAGAPPLLDLIPYGVNAAFWSDRADKERWLGLPDGENIAVPDNGDWELPNGTVIVKHFRLGARLAETRLFMRHPDGDWAGYTYQWNEAQTDATRVRGGLIAEIEGQDWAFPSEYDCMFCHNGAAAFSLGLETAQLNGAHSYPQTGRTRNQIATLNAIRALSPPVAPGAPAYVDPLDPAQTLDARARSYLHTNCSFCHRPGGPTPALMDLRHDTPLAATRACDVPPTRGDLGIPDARIIAPGEPDRSELPARMSRRDFNGMPPIASRLPDTEGVALIRAWIGSLAPASCQ